MVESLPCCFTVAQYVAARQGHVAVVELLLETGRVDVNISPDREGETPLWWAARGEYQDIIMKLLDTGQVDVNVRDINGLTPLWFAARHGHLRHRKAAARHG